MRRQALSAALLLAMMTVVSPAAAQPAAGDTVDFVVSPSRLEIRVEPGAQLDVAVDVYNRAESKLVLDTYVEDVTIPASDLVSAQDLAFTASRWVSFATTQLEIGPVDSTEVSIQVDIPEDTPTGGYHAFAFLQSRPVESSDGLLPSGRIGVTLLVEVATDGRSPDRRARVAFSETAIDWASWFRPQVRTTTIVENTGDTHVVIGGLHTVRRWPGSSTEAIEVGPHTALRGSRHAFETTAPAPLLGKVGVTSEIVYQVAPDELPVIVTQQETWVIPWHLLATLTTVAAAFWLWRRRNKRTDMETA